LKILGINHVAIASKDPKQTRWFFETALGLNVTGTYDVPAQQTSTTFIETTDINSTESAEIPALELVVPIKAHEGPLGKYLLTKGSGIHHIALTVDDLEALRQRLVELEIKIIQQPSDTGAHNTKIAFVHPHSTGGILVELVEKRK
jgi:methylmalonyl-CoA/ethylmalonyl-CoA epimerase